MQAMYGISDLSSKKYVRGGETMSSNWLEYALLTGFCIFLSMIILVILHGAFEVFIG